MALFRSLSALTRALTVRQLPVAGYSAASTVASIHHPRSYSTAAENAPAAATPAAPAEMLWPTWKLKKLKKAHPKGAWMYQLDDAGILELSQRSKVNGQ